MDSSSRGREEARALGTRTPLSLRGGGGARDAPAAPAEDSPGATTSAGGGPDSRWVQTRQTPATSP